jgi:5'-3' exonuclease
MFHAGCRDVIFVFDGYDDPAKEEEHVTRREARRQKEEELQSLYTQNPTDDVKKQVNKLKKECCYPRNDVIPIVVE